MSDFLSETGALLEDSLRFRVARQGVLASNLANVDTPGYRRTDMTFAHTLDQASLRMRSTHEGHRGPGTASQSPWRIEQDRRVMRPDGNGIEFDTELIQVNRNAGAFQEHADLYSRLVALVRMAITGDVG